MVSYTLLWVAIAFIVAGAILAAVYPIPVGPTSVAVIVLIIGVIFLIVFAILVLVGVARGAGAR